MKMPLRIKLSNAERVKRQRRKLKQAGLCSWGCGRWVHGTALCEACAQLNRQRAAVRRDMVKASQEVHA